MIEYKGKIKGSMRLILVYTDFIKSFGLHYSVKMERFCAGCASKGIALKLFP